MRHGEPRATGQLMRRELLELHRALVETERREYERVRGRMSDRAFLEALIAAPELAWLHPLTSLIVRLEELLEEGPAQASVEDCIAQMRKLLRPVADGEGFQRKYADAMQRSAEVVVAHGRAMRALQASP
jgi:hypothetical protein